MPFGMLLDFSITYSVHMERVNKEWEDSSLHSFMEMHFSLSPSESEYAGLGQVPALCRAISD